MAQAQVDSCKPGQSCNVTSSSDSDVKENPINGVPECAVCLQVCIHPARLPCNHVFCYLCVKGVANQSKRCPMCRQEIPPDFLECPQLIELDQNEQKEATTAIDESEQEYQWFYEGRNGWWQYDQRTNLELETAYKQGKRSCELLIAGFLYIADFGSMLQLRRNDHSRRRRIKRDLSNAPKKGVAGLRLNNGTNRLEEDQEEVQVIREIRGAESSTVNDTAEDEDGSSDVSILETSSEGAESGADSTVLNFETILDQPQGFLDDSPFSEYCYPVRIRHRFRYHIYPPRKRHLF